MNQKTFNFQRSTFNVLPRLLLLASLVIGHWSLPSARADFEIKYYLTITNIPAGLTTNLVANIGTATTRNWTNSASGAPSTSIQTTNSTAAAATNLLAHLNDYPVYAIGSSGPRLGVDSVSSNTSTLVFTAPENTNLTVSFGGNWARGFYVTNPLTSASPILWPTNAMSLRARTNAANAIVNYLGGTVPANSIPPANYAFRHYTDNTSPQTLSNKTFIGAVLEGGRFLNATNVTGSNVFYTNVTLHIANITGAQLSGIITALTNGAAYNLRLVNSTNSGYIVALTNGTITNVTLLSPKSTNLVNGGNAISSPYGVTGGEQFGSGATAAGINATAIGKNATASAVESAAFGYGASAIASSATAVGDQAGANGPSTTVVGYLSTASTNYAGAFGASSTVTGERAYSFGYNNTLTHSNTVVVGNQLTSSGDNLIELGSTAQTVKIPGLFGSFTGTNATLRGINTINGRLDFTPGANTGLANGYSSDVSLGTNVYVKLSGHTTAATNAGFRAAASGTYHIVQIDNPTLNHAILDDSGLDTAANRIFLGDATTKHSTNNPVIMQIIYDGGVSRWRLISFR